MSAPPEIARANGKKGGRPFGSFTKPRLADHFTEKDIKKLIDTIKNKADEGDITMLRFVAEQLYGKAPQTIDHTQGGGKELPTPILQLNQVNIKNNAILPNLGNK